MKISFGLASAYLLAEAAAFGCSCAEITICDALRNPTSAVFVGEVIRGGIVGPKRDAVWPSHGGNVILRVIERFHNVPASTKEVTLKVTYPLEMCSPTPYYQGTRVLVVAESFEVDRGINGACSISNPESESGRELQVLRYLKADSRHTLLSGEVVASKPVEGVQITVRSTKDPKVVMQTRSGKDGTFEFRNIQPGSYLVEKPKMLDGPKAVTIPPNGCAMPQLW